MRPGPLALPVQAIVSAALQQGVKLMVDAEHSYFQPVSTYAVQWYSNPSSTVQYMRSTLAFKSGRTCRKECAVGSSVPCAGPQRAGT